jgi:hypothetical protein
VSRPRVAEVSGGRQRNGGAARNSQSDPIRSAADWDDDDELVAVKGARPAAAKERREEKELQDWARKCESFRSAERGARNPGKAGPPARPTGPATIPRRAMDSNGTNERAAWNVASPLGRARCALSEEEEDDNHVVRARPKVGRPVGV